MKKNSKFLYLLLFPLLIAFLGANWSWGKGKPPKDDPDTAAYDIEIYPAAGFDGVWGEAVDIDELRDGVGEANLDEMSVVNADPDKNWVDAIHLTTQFAAGELCFGPIEDGMAVAQLDTILLGHNTRRGNDLAVAELFFQAYTEDGGTPIRYRLYMNGSFLSMTNWPPAEMGESATMELTYWKTRVGGSPKNAEVSCVGEINPSDTSFKTILTVTRVK